jgi:uncharacterized protein YecE (DUF72 family)
MYWSKYDQQYLTTLAARVRQYTNADAVWCVFDNTAMGTAIENALEFQDLVRSGGARSDAVR